MFKYINKKKWVLLNLKIYNTILKILPNIVIFYKGFSVTLNIKKKDFILYLNILKKNSSFLFKYLIDISVIDYPWKKNRFFVGYVFRSLTYNKIMYCFLKCSNFSKVFSISSLYSSSNWAERECWDFFGVFFFLNKNLKRILTDYGFKGHPLKKDFPLLGFNELYYNVVSSFLKYKKI